MTDRTDREPDPFVISPVGTIRGDDAVFPCPYTVGRRACTAGNVGHPGPHVWPTAREIRAARKAATK